MNRNLLGRSLLVALLLLGSLGIALAWPRAPLESVLTSPVDPGMLVVCYGYVDARQGLLLLQPARAGRVMRVFVQERQTVGKDTPLLQVDDHLIRLQEEEAGLAVQAAQFQLARARNGVKQFKAKQAQAEAGFEAAQNKVLAAQHGLTRREELVQKQLASQLEEEVDRAQMNAARALVKVEQNRLVELAAVDPELEVRLAQLELNRTKAQRERARQEREQYLLQAPVAGLVLRLQAQEGDLVGPTSSRPAIWLAPSGPWIVRAEVVQEFAADVRKGQTVQVEDEASARLLAKGVVAEVSDWFLPRRQLNALPTSINTGLTLECVIELEEPHGQLRFGQRVRVRMHSDQTKSG